MAAGVMRSKADAVRKCRDFCQKTHVAARRTRGDQAANGYARRPRFFKR